MKVFATFELADRWINRRRNLWRIIFHIIDVFLPAIINAGLYLAFGLKMTLWGVILTFFGVKIFTGYFWKKCFPSSQDAEYHVESFDEESNTAKIMLSTNQDVPICWIDNYPARLVGKDDDFGICNVEIIAYGENQDFEVDFYDNSINGVMNFYYRENYYSAIKLSNFFEMLIKIAFPVIVIVNYATWGFTAWTLLMFIASIFFRAKFSFEEIFARIDKMFALEFQIDQDVSSVVDFESLKFGCRIKAVRMFRVVGFNLDMPYFRKRAFLLTKNLKFDIIETLNINSCSEFESLFY
ncbi:MAG: hypothetical protein Q4A21_01995 [bacterium]|nr:hypothetical protein [bacterium]